MHKNRLLRFQKNIHRALQREAKNLLGQTPPAIARYEREFERDFRATRLRVSTKAKLIAAIREAQVTFVADYHTLSQAARTALRLMRDACQPGERWVIGLEMIPSSHQSALDAFQEGALSEEEFLSHIHYREEWGFPWQNYAPIFEWARKKKIKLLALNLPKQFTALARAEGDLQERDRWAAGILTDEIALHPKTRMIVLYGELHVASTHLPAALQEVSTAYLRKGRKASPARIQTLIVHQNHDGLYWRLAARGIEHQAHILELKKDRYCVFSSTPWNKLQSLVSWTETGTPGLPAWPLSANSSHERNDPLLEDWELDLHGEEPDFHALLETHGRAIALLLGVQPPHFENLTVRTIDQMDFIDSLLKGRDLPPMERRLAQERVERNRRLYLPGVGVAYLGTPTSNRSAELAAAHLLYSALPPHGLKISSLDDFCRWILENAFTFFGSLILHPKRKCDLAADLKRALPLIQRDPELSQKDRQVALRASQLALEILESEKSAVRSGDLKNARLSRELSERGFLAKVTLLESARLLGRVLGKRLHHALMEEKIEVERLRELFLLEPRDHAWSGRYLEILKTISGVKLTPSKRDWL